ncbi:TonB-dependent receptor [Cytophagales bacterium LB-30]|uniref:TonB-dependent receptor n=1 Tax=Shiella aurantiaca TaxID=3058365 RepID=A0ABT8F8N1_9BACT|nr:TonB-dependent receptor [Shiella aurantiaca]MDN4166638.1 TonB-dependent receptor [Shiella aurantiaca]
MRHLLVIGIFSLLPFSLLAQRNVKGTVTSATSGETLPGVNIRLLGTDQGTVTDINGSFSLVVERDSAQLQFSFLGFKTFTTLVGSRSVIDVQLEDDTQQLDEIVVVGYGTQKKSDLTGSVARVKGSELTKIPSSSPLQGLQGKVAGVQISNAGGAPGAGAVIRVRGVGTFNNSNPIFVVDGVILDNIDFLNAADIEAMDVLKDASATAIYGSRGANGVIIVTTKRAKKGQVAPTINFSADYSIQKLQKRIALLDGREFATVANELRPGSYNNIDLVPNTDWQDLIFKDGLEAPILNAQLSATGASDKGQYYLGAGYFKHEGIIPKSQFERLTVKFNNSYQLSSRLQLGTNITLTPFKAQNTNNNVVFIAYRAWPVLEPYNADGSFAEIPGTGNPLADIEYTNSFNQGLRSIGNTYFTLDLIEGLQFKSSYGIEVDYSSSESFTPEFFVSPQQQNPLSRLNKGFYNRLSWLWENTLSYQKEIGLHRLDALAGFTAQKSTSEFVNLPALSLVRDTPDFWYINPNNINPNEVGNGVDGSNYFSMLSQLFRVNYSFNNRYLLTATLRRDGSSKFPTTNRFALFPAVAVGWNIINEAFMSPYEAITNLKLKASWGVIGNDKIPYDRQYSLVGNGINAVFGPEDAIIPGQTYSSAGNPDLRWESTEQFNAGVEMAFWENTLSAELEFFRKITYDILINLPIPGYYGNGSGASITTNSAEVLNQGLEFNLGYRNSIGDLNYSVGVLGNTLHNEVLKVRGTNGDDDFLTNGAGTTRSSVGLPIGAFYGYEVDGVFQNQSDLDAYPHRSDAFPGDLRFVDTNEDGQITDADRTYIGSPIPSLLYAFNLGAEYKGWDVAIDFQGQRGNDIYNIKETIRPDLYNYEQHVANRWTGENTSNTEPRASQGGYNYLPSSFFVQSGSFFRLRNITLGYSLPEGMTNRLKAQQVRFFVSGTNVFTLSPFTGYNPEILGDPINSGIDLGGYPFSAMYSTGIRVTF